MLLSDDVFAVSVGRNTKYAQPHVGGNLFSALTSFNSVKSIAEPLVRAIGSQLGKRSAQAILDEVRATKTPKIEQRAIVNSIKRSLHPDTATQLLSPVKKQQKMNNSTSSGNSSSAQAKLDNILSGAGWKQCY